MHDSRVEFWTTGSGIPVAGWRRAVRAEQAGYDGIVYVDSQNLAGDPYVAMALAAGATNRIKLGTGVTNPFTRHPAVTASCIASVQAESGGRAALGVGRGDSALAHLGFAPASVSVLGSYVQKVRAFLRGDEVPFDAGGDVDRLELAGRPASSRLQWLRPAQPVVPVDVAATGPRVIRMAAVLADRVMFAVGADPHRLRWAIATARAARAEAGLDPDGIPFGAYVTVIVHPDPRAALRLGEGGVSLFARFSAMHGRVVGPASDEDRAVLTEVHDAYDMRDHARVGSAQAGRIDAEFAARFAVLGPPAYCVERLRQLAGLGLDRFVIGGPSMGADRAEASAAEGRFVQEVLPAFRA